MNKKKLAVVSLVICLVAIASLGSLAWFTDSDTVTNTFKFVTSFEVDLYETDEDGNIVGEEGDTTGLTFEGITPNAELKKDPTVVNKSATESQYIRMTVTLSNAAEWVAALGETVNLDDIFTGFDSDAWKRYDAAPTVDADTNTISVTYYLEDTLASGATATLFTGVHIPSSITVEQAADLNGTTLTVKAEAMQASNLGDAVATAYDAFNTPAATEAPSTEATESSTENA